MFIDALIVVFIMVSVAVPAYFVGQYVERTKWNELIQSSRRLDAKTKDEIISTLGQIPTECGFGPIRYWCGSRLDV